MAHTKTADILRMVPQGVAQALYEANDPSGAPTDRDLKILSQKEQPALRGTLLQVAQDLRVKTDGPVTNRMVAKEAIRRVRLALRAVAGPQGSRDGLFLAKNEIARIKDDEVRAIVGDLVSLRANIDNWFTKDPELDGVQGTGADRAHEALKGQKLKEVIVAVIDSGIDIEHEDLQGKIWTNPNEIAGTGRDDDGNGYIDDTHGWNFLGTTDAEGKPVNVAKTSLEVTREVARFEAKAAAEGLAPEESKTYKKLKKEVDAGKAYAEKLFEKTGRDFRHHYDLSLDERASVIGDDVDDFTDTNYGNNDVRGPKARHGTHVAGIIAASRGNGIGFDGVAEHVKIMPIRAVPDGDEYDKDVANGIRYAVDNGADIINMSFGKKHSPHADKVTEALAYAASKGVLIVHAAGNNSENNDEIMHYPLPPKGEAAGTGTWIEVGAMSAQSTAGMPAIFSNYGAESVDVFAPGVKINATLPDDKYGALSGTSMATPAVAGVLAIMKSVAPQADAVRLKQVLFETVREYPNLSVWVPYRKSRKRQRVGFSELSKTGGVVDAYAAIMKLQQESKAV